MLCQATGVKVEVDTHGTSVPGAAVVLRNLSWLIRQKGPGQNKDCRKAQATDECPRQQAPLPSSALKKPSLMAFVSRTANDLEGVHVPLISRRIGLTSSLQSEAIKSSVEQ